MNQEKIIENIKMYQKFEIAHPLTCDNSYHEILEPKILSDKIVLQCPTCNSIQYNIPQMFLDEDFEEKIECIKRYYSEFINFAFGDDKDDK